MNPVTLSPSRARRWLVPVAFALALAGAAPAGAAPWPLEPIGASEGVRELHDLDFDADGRALLSWEAQLAGHVPPAFGGLAARDPAGGWVRPPNLAGVDPQSAQIHLHSHGRALLVAREGGAAGPGRRRIVVADGQADGGFGALRGLAAFAARSWSASNASGDAIVAWTSERNPFLTVSERRDGRGFGRPRDMALARSASVAINARGDRLLAWPDGRRLAVRVRRDGGSWGPIVRFGRLPSDRDRRVTALVTDAGRMLVAWGRDRGHCGVAVLDGRGTWRARRLELRCGPAAVGPRDAPVVPFADSSGTPYVAWTHRTSRANSVTLARVGARGPARSSVVSRQRGAMLDDVATGPAGAVAVTWAAVLSRTNPLLTATYAALRRGSGAFAVERLSPASSIVARGSRVAFHPLTGQAVVAIPYRVGRTLAVGAAVSPPAR